MPRGEDLVSEVEAVQAAAVVDVGMSLAEAEELTLKVEELTLKLRKGARDRSRRGLTSMRPWR